AAERVAAADLDDAEAEWLACRHALEVEHVMRFRDAARLAREAQLPDEHEALFGLVMQAMPNVLEALVAQSAASLTAALERAIEANTVGAGLAARVPSIVEALQSVIVRLALRDPAPDRPTFALLLDLADTPTGQREALLSDYAR